MSLNRSNPELVSIVRPELVSRRRLPVNFSPDDDKLFQHDLQRTIPQTDLIRFRDVWASSEGLLFDGLRLLPQSFAFPSELKEWKLRSIARLVATNYLFRRRRTIDHEVLWITDYWSSNYFHWLTDALSRLFVVQDRLNKIPLLLPGSFESSDHVTATLKAFGVTNVDYVRWNEVVECRNLLMPTHTAPSGHYNDDVIRNVRSILLKAYDQRSNARTGERVYLSRGRTTKRRIANEDEVSETLSNYGFRTIHAEDLSFDQQLQMFSQTRYLISNHGAGLTNMFFMPEGASVLELRCKADAIRNWFFILSSALNLNYFYQTCEPQGRYTDPHYADLLVDVATLKRNLNLFLS
jgi:capsular polysaccharide biosynthesis protein